LATKTLGSCTSKSCVVHPLGPGRSRVESDDGRLTDLFSPLSCLLTAGQAGRLHDRLRRALLQGSIYRTVSFAANTLCFRQASTQQGLNLSSPAIPLLVPTCGGLESLGRGNVCTLAKRSVAGPLSEVAVPLTRGERLGRSSLLAVSRPRSRTSTSTSKRYPLVILLNAPRPSSGRHRPSTTSRFRVRQSRSIIDLQR
jgi:hypothetical protein